MIFKSSQAGQRGAILIMLLVMVVILGLAASMAGQSWRSTLQRAREAELLWRGQQYQQAIASYSSVKHGAQQVLRPRLDICCVTRAFRAWPGICASFTTTR